MCECVQHVFVCVCMCVWCSIKYWREGVACKVWDLKKLSHFTAERGKGIQRSNWRNDETSR